MEEAIGKTVDIITNANVRYRGRVHSIDQVAKTMWVADVKMFGTESRVPEDDDAYRAPIDDLYQYLEFQGTQILNMKFVEPPSTEKLNDPAILSSNMPPPPPSSSSQQQQQQQQQQRPYQPHRQQQQQQQQMGPQIPTGEFDFQAANKGFNKEDFYKQVSGADADDTGTTPASGDGDDDRDDDAQAKIGPVYDKKSSFFDDLDLNQSRVDHSVFRAQNMDTFGASGDDNYHARGARGNNNRRNYDNNARSYNNNFNRRGGYGGRGGGGYRHQQQRDGWWRRGDNRQ